MTGSTDGSTIASAERVSSIARAKSPPRSASSAARRRRFNGPGAWSAPGGRSGSRARARSRWRWASAYAWTASDFPRRADRVRIGLGDEARLREVVGQVCRRPDRAGVGQVRASFEAAREALVEATPAPRQQLGLDDLAEQLVAEPEGAGGRVELEHAMVERGAETVVDLRVGHIQDLCKQAVVDRSAGNGGGLDQRHGPRIESRDPRQEDVDHRPRVLGLTGREQLLHEQRVALGAPPDALRHAGLEAAAPDQPQLVLHGIAVEPPELEDDRGVQAFDLREPGEDRVPPRTDRPLGRSG